ncbi:MAG: hypothetical protein IT240_10495 [Bacteroidia bacterium]|nr:hypothetical protein [Bacteroidia bacterium]
MQIGIVDSGVAPRFCAYTAESTADIQFIALPPDCVDATAFWHCQVLHEILPKAKSGKQEKDA